MITRFLVVLLSLSAIACAGIGEHRVAAAVVPLRNVRWTRWEEVFASPTGLDVTAYQTGRIEVGAEILIDANNPRTPASSRGRQWVPALSYLVRHPSQGRFLMDTGLPRADARGRCDYGIEPFFHAPCLAQSNQDIASQLQRDDVAIDDLRFVLISHLHGDHAGGLGRLARNGNITVTVAPQEWNAAARTFRAFDGYLSDQLRANFDVAALPLERMVEMPYVGHAWDLFGDGSVWVFLMPGHTRGELATLLNTTSGPRLFTFDVAHLRANFDHDVPPGFTVDRDGARDGLRRLIALRNAFPQIRVYFGHEPDQWRDQPITVPLARDMSPLASGPN